MKFLENLDLLILALIGGTLYILMDQLNRGSDSKNWPSVTGIVESSKIYEDSYVGSVRYGLAVVYQYTVDGLELKNDVIQFGYNAHLDRSSAEELLKNYQMDMEVEVFYNPNYPKMSTLITGVGRDPLFYIFVYVVFIIAGGLIAVIRNKRKKAGLDKYT